MALETKPGRGPITRWIVPILSGAAMLLAAGCSCSAQESKWIYMNQTTNAAVVKIDGSVLFLTYQPFQSDSYCLDRSTPHVVSITYHAWSPQMGMGPPVGSEGFTIIWREPQGWVQQSGDVSWSPPVLGGAIPDC